VDRLGDVWAPVRDDGDGGHLQHHRLLPVQRCAYVQVEWRQSVEAGCAAVHLHSCRLSVLRFASL
jgi:hypothetical protein